MTAFNTRLAVVGNGKWGRNLIRNFVGLLGPEHVVCCDRDPTMRTEVHKAFPNVPTRSDPEDVWSDDTIDAVAVATPTPMHYEMARRALEADKHVFVEKPLALRTEDAQMLTKLAEKRQRKLMVDHLLLYHPAVEELIDMTRRGHLGGVYYLYSQRLNLGVIRTEENALWSLGAHDIAVLLELLGDAPVEVLAEGGVFLQKEDDIADVVFLTIKFSKGTIAHLHLSWLDPHKIRKITVVGSDKMAVFDDMQPREKLTVYDKSAYVDTRQGNPQVRYGDIVMPSISFAEPLGRACEHFLDCVSNDKQPRTDGEAGIQAVRVLEAAQRSLEGDGRPVDLAAEKEPS